MTRIGIIYYSRSGTGRTAAERLAAISNWPAYEIRDETPRVGLSGDIRCTLDALARRRPSIHYEGPSLNGFDHLILITPVWLRSVAAPMRTFLQRYGPEIGNYSVICVLSGYGGLRAVDDIAAIIKTNPKFILLLKQYEALAGKCDDALYRLKERFSTGSAAHETAPEISMIG